MMQGVALCAGLLAALLQAAGALKSIPAFALPLDLSLLAGVLLLPALLLLGCGRCWQLAPALGVPVAAAALLWLWLLLSGCWSTSQQVLAEKLPQLLLLGPAMLLAGVALGADAAARRGLVAGTLALGLLIATALLHGQGLVGLQYQLTGLSLATAAGLAAWRITDAEHALGALWWLGITGLLAFATLLPGGRAALLGMALAVVGVPMLALVLQARWAAAMIWAAVPIALGLLALQLVLDDPAWLLWLRSLRRFVLDPEGASPARITLWVEALRWAAAAPWGLGIGGFTIAAGSGDDRHLHAHNHALDALVEGGIPGLAFWLLAFGGAVLLALRFLPRVAPGRAAAITALALPSLLAAMVSTDLGNRMVWFAAGLLLSLAVEVKPRHV